MQTWGRKSGVYTFEDGTGSATAYLRYPRWKRTKSMPNKRSLLAVLMFVLMMLAIVLFASGCDTQADQDAFADDASQPPANITRTDDTGQTDTMDEDDWRVAPVYRGRLRINPVYPNPTDGGVVTLEVFVLEQGAIRGGLRLRARNPQNANDLLLLDDVSDATDAGIHVLTFSPALLGDGLHRLFVFDGLGEIVTYGDLQIE